MVNDYVDQEIGHLDFCSCPEIKTWCIRSVNQAKMGGKYFGNLAKYRHVITYSLSPFEQRAFAGLSRGFANGVRRWSTNLMYMAPGFISLVAIYNWGKKENLRMKKKNPKDYENDE